MLLFGQTRYTIQIRHKLIITFCTITFVKSVILPSPGTFWEIQYNAVKYKADILDGSESGLGIQIIQSNVFIRCKAL